MSAAESDYHRALAEAILIGPRRLPIFRLSGSDVPRYLQGRITQDVKALAPGESARSLVITPQGKIQGQFLLFREGDSFLVISDPLSTPEAAEEFLAALLQFKVADDVNAADLSNSFEIFSAIGPGAEELAKNFPGTHLIIPRRFGKLPAFDILAPSGTKAENTASPEALEMIRITEKIPRMEADLTEKILAPEIDVTDLVAFDKGCYAGQEVVEMATARGRPNRTLALFEGEGEAAPEPGTELFAANDPGKSVGWLTSGCAFPSEKKFRALGFLKTASKETGPFLAKGERGVRPVSLI